MLDEFIWGKVSRISPEAPVPVVNVTGESYYPGGAANVARNVREFTRGVAVMGLAGTDSAWPAADGTAAKAPASTLPRSSRMRPCSDHREDPDHRPQPAGGARGPRAEIAADPGADRARHGAPGPRRSAAWTRIIVADYGKGFLTQPLADHICRTARAHGKILTVDPHPHTSLSWQGATAIKPNRAEAFIAAGLPPSDPVRRFCDDRALLEAGRRLLGLWKSDSLLITLGEHGMLLLSGRARRRTTRPRVPRSLRRLRRRRYGDCGFHAGACRGRLSRRSRRAGQSRQRHRGGQTGHRYRDPGRAAGEHFPGMRAHMRAEV